MRSDVKAHAGFCSEAIGIAINDGAAAGKPETSISGCSRFRSGNLCPPFAETNVNARRGFTLVELMGVIVILGLLASIITVSVRRYMITSRQNIARLEISKICQAVESFYVESGRYPDTTEGLTVLVGTAEKPDGFLPGTRIADDPWGHPYDYVIPGTTTPYEVLSYGGDGKSGGTGVNADLSSAELDSVR